MAFNLAAATTTLRLQEATISNAVTSLLKYKSEAQSETGKAQLLPDEDYVYLQITLKKIPSHPRTNPFKIPLTHPILDAASQICLIIDDRPKSPTPPSDELKKLIKSLDIPISKVIRISKLKANYKPFEAKRKLCHSYDLFLVDKRVVHLLPKLLGKEFFKKKKLPLVVDLSRKGLKGQVERVLGSALLYLRTGTCCVMKVGKMGMENDEIVENVMDAVNGAVERVAKKWDGIRSLFLKFSDTLALPLYQAMPDVKLKIEGLKEMEKKAEIAIAKSSDNEGEMKDASGRKDGKKKNKKGRIHEVHYMDVGESEDDVNDNETVDDTEKVKSVVSVDVSVGKKRKKDKASKEGALVASKGLKSKSKGKKYGLPSEDLPAETKGKNKKKSELVELKAEKSISKAREVKSEDDDVDDNETLDDTEKVKSVVSVDVSVGKKRKKNNASKEVDVGASNGLKSKSKVKKDVLPSEDLPTEMKGKKKKKKSELGELKAEKTNSKARDVKKAKKSLAK